MTPVRIAALAAIGLLIIGADFASHLLSMLADGLLVAAAAVVLWKTKKAG